jgi:HK97 family phage portal protein
VTRLIDRLFGARAKLPDPEMVAMVQTWGNGRGTESIAPTFVSYAADGYSGNGPVFACLNARLRYIGQAEFKFQDLAKRNLYGTPALGVLENPWPNGTATDLLKKMEQHASLAGNAFVWRAAPDRLVCLRPDWVEIVSADYGGYREPIGYVYQPGGISSDAEMFIPVDDMAHWAPIPDPLADYRGMSWLTPIAREVNADVAMTQHRTRFFENNATPNLVIRYDSPLSASTVAEIGERWNARYGGPTNAGGTAILDRGADLTVVGQSFEQMRFNDVQSAGEARIAAASGVPAIVAQIQAGLDSGTYANYEQAMRAFANGTLADLWSSAVAALAKFVQAPTGARLWFDTGNIPALQDAETARAEAAQVNAAALSTLITAGYTPDAAVSAINAGDLSLLTGQHSGLVSVQMQKPGAVDTPTPPPVESPKRDELLEAVLARMAQPQDATDVQVVIGEGAITTNTTIADGAIRTSTTVEPTQVRNEFTVPQAPAPDVVVNVERDDTPPAPAPVVNVTVEPTPVTVTNEVHPSPLVMPARRTTTKVDRDARTGLITKTTATETDA